MGVFGLVYFNSTKLPTYNPSTQTRHNRQPNLTSVGADRHLVSLSVYIKKSFIYLTIIYDMMGPHLSGPYNHSIYIGSTLVVVVA